LLVLFSLRPLQAVLATLGTISVVSAAVEVLVRCDLYPEPASIVNLFLSRVIRFIKQSSRLSLPSFCASQGTCLLRSPSPVVWIFLLPCFDGLFTRVCFVESWLFGCYLSCLQGRVKYLHMFLCLDNVFFLLVLVLGLQSYLTVSILRWS
jgi:hypothetical protein